MSGIDLKSRLVDPVWLDGEVGRELPSGWWDKLPRAHLIGVGEGLDLIGVGDGLDLIELGDGLGQIGSGVGYSLGSRQSKMH